MFDRREVSGVLDLLQGKAREQAEKDLNKLYPDFKESSLLGKGLRLAPIIIVGAGLVGGFLAGAQSDPDSPVGQAATKTKKLAIVLGDIGLGPKTKVRIQYDFRKDKPPDPNAMPGVGFPAAPAIKGNVQLEFKF